MKIAQCTYNQAGTTIRVQLTFDNKAFAFIYPRISAEEENDLIRLISDSVAAIQAKDSAECAFFIKRVIRDGQQFKLFCTNGFLIDEALIVPSSQQAFGNERITIIETEQFPAKLKMNVDFLNKINERLPAFEEDARQQAPTVDAVISKEVAKEAILPLYSRQIESGKVSETLAEIGNIKKEIFEIAEMNTRAMKQLSEQIQNASHQVLDDVMEETQSNLKQEHNKQTLVNFAESALQQFGGNDVETAKQLLQKKMDEIIAIPNVFNKEIDSIANGINERLNTMSALKKLVIEALHKAAVEFKQQQETLFNVATPNNKKIMITDFNRKFSPFAVLNEQYQLSSLDKVIHALGHSSLEALQQYISNPSKDEPGIIQKCNTSWTEESPELKIVMKYLNTLNKLLSELFKAQPEFAEYAHQPMTEITRIPFPRSFQFKFTAAAMQFKNAIESECKTQKDRITQLAKTFRRTLQVDEVREKARKAIIEIQKQLSTIKTPIVTFRDLLIQKERAETIMLVAKQYINTNNEVLAAVKIRQEAVANKIDPSFKLMKQKIQKLNQALQIKASEITDIEYRMQTKNDQIESIIKQFNPINFKNSRLSELENNTRDLEVDKQLLSEQVQKLLTLKDHLAIYDQAFQLSDDITTAIAESNVRKQQSEAKNFLLSIIKDEKRDVASTAELKKNMIDVYAQIDTQAASIDKINNELLDVKKALFNELNSKNDNTIEDLSSTFAILKEKIAAHEVVKKMIQENLSMLRKMSLEGITSPKNDSP